MWLYGQLTFCVFGFAFGCFFNVGQIDRLSAHIFHLINGAESKIFFHPVKKYLQAEKLSKIGPKMFNSNTLFPC